jgi:hypothetical protein
MVTFEDVMKKMADMSKEQVMAAIADNKRMCICGTCPTYADSGETELVFCATKKSAKISVEKGCTCPGCPVTEKMGLRWDYYCTKGTGREQLSAAKK